MRYSLILFLLSNNWLFGQQSQEYAQTLDIGVQSGVNWFFGDIGGRNGNGKKWLKDWNIGQTHSFFDFTAGYNFSDHLSANLRLSGGAVSATDNKLDKLDPGSRYHRNLSFKSSVTEMALTAHYTLRFYSETALGEKKAGPWAPYVGIGAGIFRFNPRTFYNGNWIYLQPLSTEGQGMSEYASAKPYSLTQFYIPAIVGLKYSFSPDWHFVSELRFRKTFTDYMDDVSKTYINPALFSKYLEPVSARHAVSLHDRSGELNAGMNRYSPGDIRGKSQKDSWVSFSVGFVFNIPLDVH